MRNTSQSHRGDDGRENAVIKVHRRDQSGPIGSGISYSRLGPERLTEIRDLLHGHNAGGRLFLQRCITVKQ